MRRLEEGSGSGGGPVAVGMRLFPCTNDMSLLTIGDTSEGPLASAEGGRAP